MIRPVVAHATHDAVRMIENKKMGMIKKVINFIKASKRHAEDGFKDVTIEEYRERLSICNKCPFQKDGECLECGCILVKKAWWRSEDCPIDKWPKQ